jgi:hypothetical protein
MGADTEKSGVEKQNQAKALPLRIIPNLLSSV